MQLQLLFAQTQITKYAVYGILRIHIDGKSMNQRFHRTGICLPACRKRSLQAQKQLIITALHALYLPLDHINALLQREQPHPDVIAPRKEDLLHDRILRSRCFPIPIIFRRLASTDNAQCTDRGQYSSRLHLHLFSSLRSFRRRPIITIYSSSNFTYTT